MTSSAKPEEGLRWKAECESARAAKTGYAKVVAYSVYWLQKLLHSMKFACTVQIQMSITAVQSSHCTCHSIYTRLVWVLVQVVILPKPPSYLARLNDFWTRVVSH